MATGYAYHPLFLWHDTGTSAALIPANPMAGIQPATHLEHPEFKRRAHELLHVSGLLRELMIIEPGPATRAQLLRVHTHGYLNRLKQQSRLGGGDAGDGHSPIGRGSYDIACLAAGAVIDLVTAVADGDITNGYALVRPPGHHALADQGMGFCLINSIAVAARHAQTLGMARVAVVDIDAHHGNGTQAIFDSDPSVLTISVHQANCFPPDSGWTHDNGAGDGTGSALNVPLPPGSGPAAWLHAMTQVVIPALDRFTPDLILLAAGFDANVFDTLARQSLTADAYRQITSLLTDAADRLCNGRLVATHEGGYSFYAPHCVAAHVETLAGLPPHITDPYAAIVAGYNTEPLLAHQRAVIEQATQLVPTIPTTAPPLATH